MADPATDLFAPIPHGQGQTILREALLVADHNAYHLGQLVVVRRGLGAWGGLKPGWPGNWARGMRAQAARSPRPFSIDWRTGGRGDRGPTCTGGATSQFTRDHTATQGLGRSRA